MPRRYVSGDLATRFWAYVERRGPDECWPWTGTRRAEGYGVLRVEGRTLRASRISYELNIGPLAPDQFACHRCDNPPCVNPAHLFAGTAGQNHEDCASKGRARPPVASRGESHHFAKLTAHQVVEIRRLHTAGATQRELARKFNVSPGNVAFIVAGKTWRTA